MRSTINLNRLTTSITISRRLRAITDTPRAADPFPITPIDQLPFPHHHESCSYLAMCQMVADGVVTLDRERWN